MGQAKTRTSDSSNVCANQDIARLPEVLARLYRRHTFGIKLGLHVEEALLLRLGNPEKQFATIHVAGTNGKGSVCVLLESILRAAGYRTGLYTSPHLVRLNERIRVGGKEISDGELLCLLDDLESHSSAVEAELGQTPTFFELTTAAAFEHFRRSAVQVAVVEVGLGGRLDATNVVMPLVSVITGIGLEHTQYLGPDLESIAREKAGIVKGGRPVVCGAAPDEARQAIEAACAERRAPFFDALERVSVRVTGESLGGQKVGVEGDAVSYGTMRLPLVGRHQAGNLATAVAAIEVAVDCGLPMGEGAVKAGVEAVVWPGRFQILSSQPPVILDGAHNPPAAVALGATLKRLLKRKPLALVVGMCDDKDVERFFSALGAPARRCWVVPLCTERSAPCERVMAAARRGGCEVLATDLATALRDAPAWAEEAGGAVCITGSLYLVGEVLALREKTGSKPDRQ